MTTRSIFMLIVVAISSLCGNVYAAPSTWLASSDFAVWGDIDNWRVVGIYDSAGFGNPVTINNTLIPHWDDAHNGNLYDADHNYLAPNPDEYWFSAPAKFLGNKRLAYQSWLEWDIKTFTDGKPDVGLILTGGSGVNAHTLYYVNMTQPKENIWTHYSIALDSTDSHWRVDSPSGAAPTEAQWRAVLLNLKGLYILGDWLYGPDQTQIDNVYLVPEPATVALLLLGGAALLRRRRRA